MYVTCQKQKSFGYISNCSLILSEKVSGTSQTIHHILSKKVLGTSQIIRLSWTVQGFLLSCGRLLLNCLNAFLSCLLDSSKSANCQLKSETSLFAHCLQRFIFDSCNIDNSFCSKSLNILSLCLFLLWPWFGWLSFLCLNIRKPYLHLHTWCVECHNSWE